MSQPSTADNTLTSEEHDQEVEEYIWNLMGRAGLLSELKSQIAQFVQNNGKTKEKFSVDVSRAQPAILAMIYEYLKWVGMKNTCALLICESPVKFETSCTFENSNGTSEVVPELCNYLSEKLARVENSRLNGRGEVNAALLLQKAINLNGSPSDPAAATTLNQTFLVGDAQQNNKLLNTSLPSSSTPAVVTNNVAQNAASNNGSGLPPSKIPTPTTNQSGPPAGSNTVQSSSYASESNSDSDSSPVNSKNGQKKKVYTAQYEKTVSESAKKNQKNDKELKPSSSDQSLLQKSKEQVQFGFMPEKQKTEALKKKFVGSDLFGKTTLTTDQPPMLHSGDPWIKNSQEPEKLNENLSKNSGSFEPDLEDESISDLHDSTADDVTQDFSIDSDSKMMAANAAECDHVLKLK